MINATKLSGRVAAWYDGVYRVTFFLVISPAPAFPTQLATLMKATSDLTRGERCELLKKVCEHSLIDCNGRCFRYPYLRHGETTGSHICIVWVRQGVDVAVLVHELWHAAYWIFDHRGVGFESLGADEPMAYYLTYLMRQALDLKGA